MDKAIIVVDMIHDFVYGKFGGERPQSVVSCVKKLLEYGRKNDIPIIYLKDAHREDDHELEVWGEHAMKGTEGSQIISELKPEPGDYVLEKTRYSSFHDTELDVLLEDLGVKKIIIAGVTTDICVRHTAADAFYRGYEIAVPSDCVNSISDDVQERALREMENLYNAEVGELEQVIA